MQEAPSVVIPCAGTAKRLGVPFPKELFPLGPDRVLIDHAIDLIGPELRDVKVIVVTRPDKLETVRYLERYAARANLAFVYQSAGTGLCAAVRSALPWCTTRIVVLLPDELVQTIDGLPPVPSLFGMLDRHPVAFLVAAESDPRRLARDGALALDSHDRVVGYADKSPGTNPQLNAVWTAFAVERAAADRLLDVMETAEGRALLPSSDLERARILGAPTVRVASVRDMGTWPDIAAHIRALSSAASQSFE